MCSHSRQWTSYVRVLMRSINFECRVSKEDKGGGSKTGTTDTRRWSRNLFNIIFTQRFTLRGDLRICESLRPKSASVSIRQGTQERATISSAKRLAGALHIDTEKKEKTMSFPHRLSRFLWTSYRHRKRAGLTKGVNRPPGPPIYQALMLNASLSLIHI